VVAAEDEFIHGLKCGDASAYEALVGRFETPLYRFFLASHGDPQLAGEQSADCFGDLVEALPKMSGGPEQLRAFVFSVARNVLRRHWRRRQYETVELEVCDRVAGAEQAVDAALEATEEQGRAIEALRELDSATRQVFILRFIEQMSIAEIAATVDEPIGSVKSRLHRGRRKLLAVLKSTSESP
jgi:RNA polymerase sigma-70 factor, ECF subfamily